MNNENKIKYDSSVNNLLENIKVNYAGWGSNPNDLEDSQKKRRLQMIDEFNNGLHIRSGIKFDKRGTKNSTTKKTGTTIVAMAGKWSKKNLKDSPNKEKNPLSFGSKLSTSC